MTSLLEELQKIEKNIYLNKVRSERSLKPIEATSEGGIEQ
jgi:hypothetical protein